MPSILPILHIKLDTCKHRNSHLGRKMVPFPGYIHETTPLLVFISIYILHKPLPNQITRFQLLNNMHLILTIMQIQQDT